MEDQEAVNEPASIVWEGEQKATLTCARENILMLASEAADDGSTPKNMPATITTMCIRPTEDDSVRRALCVLTSPEVWAALPTKLTPPPSEATPITSYGRWSRCCGGCT
jgi:hypothetical protein